MKRVLEDFPRSGLTVKDFCHRQGISTAKFYYWQRKLEASEDAGFAPIHIAEPEETQITLPNGTCVGVSSRDVSWIADLLFEIDEVYAQCY